MFADSGNNIIQSSLRGLCGQGACGPSSLPGVMGSIANVLIFLVGAVSVIMVIIGGLRYVISMGRPKQVEQAKNTILYAVVGVIVAISSYAIVNFVLSSLK